VTKKLFWVLVIIVFTPCIAFAQKDVTIELEGRWWFTELQGKVKVTDHTGRGTDIDLKEVLGVKDEGIPEIRLTWYPGKKSKIWAEYGLVGYDGDKSIDRTIQFGNVTYPLNARVKTDLDLQYLDLAWAWQFIYVDNGLFKLGTLLKAKILYVDASLEAPDNPSLARESENFFFGFPMLGVAMDFNPHKMLNIFAQGSGLYAGSYGYTYDAEIGIKLIPIKILSIVGGYRIMEAKVEHDDDYVRAKFYGPFVGVTVRF